MPKTPTAFGANLDKGMVRNDSQVIPVPRISVPMPKSAAPAPQGKGLSAGEDGENATNNGAKSSG